MVSVGNQRGQDAGVLQHGPELALSKLFFLENRRIGTWRGKIRVAEALYQAAPGSLLFFLHAEARNEIGVALLVYLAYMARN